jgi:two-component system, cell cycle sensor histidine kinase and response regulator CckA
MLELIQRALSDCEVAIAPDGDTALALVTPGESLDLVITDYLMPSMLGDELLERLRERRPHLKALVITGHTDMLARELPDWWKREPHLSKPFTVADLRQAVHRLLAPNERPIVRGKAG